VPLNEDERPALLREASPLLPAATPARLAAEQRLGQAIAAAVEGQWLLGTIAVGHRPARQARLLQRAVQQGNAALQGLRSAVTFTASTQPSERAAFAELQRTTRGWLTLAQSTVSTSQLSLQSFKSPVAQPASRHRTQPAKPRKPSSRPCAIASFSL
jgi:hypothetical protein